MKKVTDKKRKSMCFEIPTDLYRELNQALLDKFGGIYGHIREAIEEGIRLWITNQKICEVNGDVKN